MKRSIRIVSYAINGAGTGHLVRLVAVNRWLRRYAAFAGARAELYFLTSSEADGLLFAERFAAFKLPSKTSIDDARIDKTTYLALAKQWVWHSMGLLRPDLFLVDTFPRGSFGELLGALDLCKKKALIFRPMQEEMARRPDLQAMLPLYDLVLIPERESEVETVVPDAARGKTRHVGPIAVRDRAELLPRERARAALGLAADATAVYVSAGGGGDPGAPSQLASTLDALLGCPEASGVELVVGAGPLYRGPVPRRPRVTWLVNENAAELALGFDAAVCAAGYNTFVELMLAGVPTVFLPQPKVADDQAARAARAERAGAARVVPAGAPRSDVARAAFELLAPEERARASLAAHSLVARSCARDAAAELLRLVLPASEVDRAEIAIGDSVLEAARDHGLGLELVVDVAHFLDGEGGGRAAARELPALVEGAIRVALRARELGVDPSTASELARGLARRAGPTAPGERERWVCEALERMAERAADEPSASSDAGRPE